MIICTYHEHAAQDAAGEIIAAFPGSKWLRRLDEGVGLFDIPQDFMHVSEVFMRRPLIFSRHIFPVLTKEDDPLTALEAIAGALNPSLTFSVQARDGTGAHSTPTRALSEALQGRGFVLDIKAPQQAVSIYRTQDGYYIGVSDTAHNLSDWNGGMMHFKSEGAVSRAEFKLLEALRTFPILPANAGQALDLGAAPGGWSRVLAERGLRVWAVDPAALDPRVPSDRVRHFPGTAMEFQRNYPDERFDLIVNDMKMDARLALDVLASFRPQLREGGLYLTTIKLPHKNSAAAAKTALDRIRREGTLLFARQLFHNRSEITAIFR